MKVKPDKVTVYNIQLSELEATAALHAIRAANSVLASKNRQKPANRKESSHQRAALAFCQSFETLLQKRGVKNTLEEIHERYGGPPAAESESPKPPPKRYEEEDDEANIQALIEDSGEEAL